MRSEEEIKSSWKNPENILVSITCIAYNHEPFIEQSIQGFLIQETTFAFELIIHDDASTDNTQEIIRKYQKLYPNLIRTILQTENHWMGKGINATTTIVWPSAKGKYIAWCEGDDYWTDSLKLQKQVDFLEANEEYVLTFHPVKILKPDGSFAEDFITTVPENYESQETLARSGNYIHTPSVVFRNIIKTFPPEFSLSPIGDYFLYMILAKHGKMKMLEGEMAVYRYGVGIFSLQSKIEKAKASFKLYSLLISYSDNTYINQILVEKLLSGINYFENLIENKYSGAFVSNHIFFRSVIALKDPNTIWTKIKSRF